MQAVSMAQIPSQIQQVVSTYQLGVLRTDYGPDLPTARRRITTGVVLCLISIVMIIVGLALAANSSSGAPDPSDTGGAAYPLMFIALVLGVIGLVYLIRGMMLKSNNPHVYLCDHGFVYTAGNTAPQPFLWNQVQAVWRLVTRHYRNNVYTGTTFRYTIQRTDGYRIVLNDDIREIERLGNEISDHITKLLLPQAIQAYANGQTVSFGALSLNQQGLGTGAKFLPWSQVEAVNIRNGFISVKQQGAWLRSTTAAATIPNLFVFLTLIDYVLKSYGKR